MSAAGGQRSNFRHLTFVALLAATIVNILPMRLFTLGGDIDFHSMLINCFAGQFWQGDLYPRWCLNANAGLGAPVFLFYFPLPYYVAALLWPLTHLGIPLYRIYVLSMALATFATGYTCYSWLRDIVSPGRALLAALLFLFIPYRMETMLFRLSYAEVWAIALLPLLMKYTRRLAKGGDSATLPLAAVFALLFLTHLPAAVAGILASGGTLMIVSWKKWRQWGRYAAGLLWGAAMAAFYLAPAAYYRRFMAAEARVEGPHGWPNTYLGWRNITELGQGRIVLTIGLTVLSLALLAGYMLWRRRRVADAFVRREIVAWACVSAAALFLLFPVSAPFYWLIGPLKMVAFPWRMQIVFPLALAFLLAVWMQWLAGEKRLKTWKGDFSMLLALLVLLSYFVLGVREESSVDTGRRLVGAYYAGEAEYRTLWTDEAHAGADYVMARYDRKNPARTEIFSGKGSITVARWAWDGIVLETTSGAGMTVRIGQRYFPVWSAAEQGRKMKLYPEPASGLMLIDAPAGQHRITLTCAAWRANPWLVGAAELASALAALLWLWRFKTARHFFDNQRGAC